MRINKEGYKIIGISGAVCLLLWWLFYHLLVHDANVSLLWFSKYHPGRFLVAWHPKSSTENERTTTVVRMPSGQKVLFRQIAGLIARRIISYMTVGHQVEQNSVCGFIKFGSRVDVLVPKDSELLVEIGDPTVGSQTPIARLRKNLENE